MGFRFRRSARLGPLRFHFSKGGLSSISVGSTGEQLWDHGLVSRLLTAGSIGAKPAGLLALIETPEAMEAYLLRAQGQDDAKRRAHRCVEAVQEAARLAAGRGWLA